MAVRVYKLYTAIHRECLRFSHNLDSGFRCHARVGLIAGTPVELAITNHNSRQPGTLPWSVCLFLGSRVYSETGQSLFRWGRFVVNRHQCHEFVRRIKSDSMAGRKSGFLHFQTSSCKKQGLSYARNAFQIHVHKQDMVKIFLWKECSVYSEDFSVISGHGPFFGEFDEMVGHASP